LLTFGDILTNSLKRSLMLTVSHPYFKIRWLTNSGDKKIAEALFLASATFSVLNRWAKAHPPSQTICPKWATSLHDLAFVVNQKRKTYIRVIKHVPKMHQN
jgi:hypothetical protein